MASDSRAKVADFIEISGEFTALNSSCPNAKKKEILVLLNSSAADKSITVRVPPTLAPSARGQPPQEKCPCLVFGDKSRKGLLAISNNRFID